MEDTQNTNPTAFVASNNENIFERFQNMFGGNKKRAVSLLVLIILVGGLLTAVLLSQQRQDVRQRASLSGLTFSIAPDTLPQGETAVVEAMLNMVDSENRNINSFDITLVLSSDNVVFTDFTSFPADFDKIIVNSVEDSGRRLHVIAINSNNTNPNTTRLGVIKLQKRSPGTAVISLDATKTIVTAKGVDAPLSATNLGQTLATYTVPAAPTTTQPTTAITITIMPTAPSSSTATNTTSLPAPSGLNAVCDSTGKKVTISWTPYTGESDGYFVILDKNPPSFNYESPANDDYLAVAGATTIQPGITLTPNVKYAVDVVIIPKGTQQATKYNPPTSQHARTEFTCTAATTPTTTVTPTGSQ